jgi:predicted RNase H-like nuclease (RuvC/YqgF family)
MSDKTKWQQIKDKCTFDNGELIQVCFADEEITRLTEQLAESESKREMLLNQLKQPDVVYAAIMRGDIAKPIIFEDARPIKEELERERIRLAACGVVALSNTPESAKQAREMHPDYESASCSDVARMVDKNMELERQLAAIDRTLLSCEYERNKYASEVMELERRNAELVEEMADGQRRIKDLLLEIKEANTKGKWQERQGDDYGTY